MEIHAGDSDLSAEEIKAYIDENKYFSQLNNNVAIIFSQHLSVVLATF